MKGIHLVAFLASLTVITASKLSDIFEAQNECPAKDTWPPTLLPHESNCAQYYECKYGQKELRVCADGLYFSKIWRGCVNKDISDCTQLEDCPGPDPPLECECKKDGTLIPHECQCDKFYECKNRKKALRECPDGEIFDGISRCICGNKDTCEPCGCCKPECKDDERKPHDCDCQKFHQCCDGKWCERDCGPGWHFSNDTMGCVCGECPKTCDEGEKKSHECCCDKYYVCRKGEWYEENCQDGKQFSSSSQACVNPKIDACSCKCENDCMKICITKWRHHCDSNLYWECKDGRKIIHQCGCGTCFSQAKLRTSLEAPCDVCKRSWIFM